MGRAFQRGCSTLRRAAVDHKRVLENLGELRESVRRRELVDREEILETLDQFGDKYEAWKSALRGSQERNRRRRELQRQLGSGEARALEELRRMKVQAQAGESELRDLEAWLSRASLRLPNLLAPGCPDREPRVVRLLGPAGAPADEKRDHARIMARKGMLDLQRASQVAGTSWYYLLNDGALLEQALVNLAIAEATQRGFAFVIPPSIVRREYIDACGFAPRDMNQERQIYDVVHTDKPAQASALGLVATAEIPLAALHANETLDAAQLPLRTVGVSRCYRAEAGARGRDTRGLYRVHEFTKVELFCWSNVEQSDELLEQIKEFQCELIKLLELPARVLDMPANDLGNPAYKKYDIEAWMPGRGSYGEVSSASNCRDFQSMRLHTKYTAEDKTKKHVHTLNGTAVAVPRLIIALVENHYDPETDKIHVPGALRRYLGRDAL